mmetsp:Transcript_104141/g.324717  ORF Transcript_104141/g.324717 Transcript_104141/m.324717 type:complete len:114 (-) Transcript_104141:74-415(-)
MRDIAFEGARDCGMLGCREAGREGGCEGGAEVWREAVCEAAGEGRCCGDKGCGVEPCGEESCEPCRESLWDGWDDPWEALRTEGREVASLEACGEGWPCWMGSRPKHTFLGRP